MGRRPLKNTISSRYWGSEQDRIKKIGSNAQVITEEYRMTCSELEITKMKSIEEVREAEVINQKQVGPGSDPQSADARTR